jgi:hypothetical protein
MSQDFTPGDFLVFQLEAGYSLLRLTAIDRGEASVYHVAGYREFFPDVESAEKATEDPGLAVEMRHAALSDRAFESTQVARISNRPLEQEFVDAVSAWRSSPEKKVSDISVRLMLGFK